MKLLIFNDSQSVEVQGVYPVEDALHIRMIHVTPDELKNLFKDTFLTKKLVVNENGKITAAYENYTTFSYIKENAGGIYEVEMIQEGKDPETRLTEVEEATKVVTEKAEETQTEMQMAIAELTMLIASMVPEGGTENV